MHFPLFITAAVLAITPFCIADDCKGGYASQEYGYCGQGDEGLFCMSLFPPVCGKLYSDTFDYDATRLNKASCVGLELQSSCVQVVCCD
ncbi:unnamed protein product [Diplocarpon coronariae]